MESSSIFFYITIPLCLMVGGLISIACALWERNGIKNVKSKLVSETAIREAVARGWCHKANECKVMDIDLAEAIVKEVMKTGN